MLLNDCQNILVFGQMHFLSPILGKELRQKLEEIVWTIKKLLERLLLKLLEQLLSSKLLQLMFLTEKNALHLEAIDTFVDSRKKNKIG